jgi:hypothetical protein
MPRSFLWQARPETPHRFCGATACCPGDFGSVGYAATWHVDVERLCHWASVVIVVWVLSNMAILYKARALFSEPAKETPGDQPGSAFMALNAHASST